MSNTRHIPGPPSSNGNGVPAGLRAVPAAEMTPEAEARMALDIQQAQQKQIHDNLAAMLAEDPATFVQRLPSIFGAAIADMVTQGVVAAVQALQAVPVNRICATCLHLRLTWNTRHKAEVDKALAAVMAELGTEDKTDPRLAQADFTPFMPEHLRPGAIDGPPQLFDSVTTVNGMDVCPQHHPSAPQQASGLILMPGIPVHAAARLAMAGQPGMAV